jgi:hypothetical protein
MLFVLFAKAGGKNANRFDHRLSRSRQHRFGFSSIPVFVLSFVSVSSRSGQYQDTERLLYWVDPGHSRLGGPFTLRDRPESANTRHPASVEIAI